MKKMLSYVLAAFAIFALASCEDTDLSTLDLEGIEDVLESGDVDAFKAALADPNTKEITLEPNAVYEGLFFVKNGPKTIKAADVNSPAIIRGKVAVVSADVTFENIVFDVDNKYSVDPTGDAQIDKIEGRRKALVPIYAGAVSFSNCSFSKLYDERNVVAIHYGAHVAGKTLNVDNCYFDGYAYAIYTRALVSVTNSVFNQTHNTENPRAIFLYGLADGNQGNVVFKGNKAMGKTSYTMELSSTTYEGNYTKTHYDVQENENFDVDGQAYAVRLDGKLDFTGTTFAEGSMEFVWKTEEVVPTGDVEAFKAALADASKTEIVLPYGIYEGVFIHNKGPKTIKSANPEKPATIKGQVAVSAEVTFENINFDVHDAYSEADSGHQYLDKYERNSIVPIYAVNATFEGCKFYNLYGEKAVVAINYGAHAADATLTVNNCYFEGYAYAIYTRALVSVTNSTFNQTHNTVNPRAIFLYGLGDGNQGNVVFKNNTAAGKESYTMQMMSKNYDYKKIHYDVQGNTNFTVDGCAYLPDLDRDFTGTTFAEGSETFDFGGYTAEDFQADLNNPAITEIVLPAGVYEGLFFQTVSPKTIKSADPANPATIKGKVAVTEDVVFENIKFDVNESSKATTNITDIDKKERDAIVAIATAKATFEGCSFYNLYDSREVVAVNYGAYELGSPLTINNCYFEGYAYAIYTRALVSVTNSTFNQTHNTANPRAIFLYGLDGKAQGNVVFKNNVAKGKTSYTMQMMSSTYKPAYYQNIHYDVQGNTNFKVDGCAYLPKVDGVIDYTGTTFAEGSETFVWKAEEEVVPTGDVAALKAALADASKTEIVLPYGVYEGLFFHTKGTKTIKSENPAKPAVIKGKVAVSNADVTFENIVFDVDDKYSVEETGDTQIDKIEGRRKAIVTVYAAATTFKGCEFKNVYDSRSVVGIHYGAYVAGKTLTVDNCDFQGYAYAIYTRALVSVTNSRFNLTHPEANPRAIFLYGLDGNTQGSVVFKNNVATDKACYSMQMSSSNYSYKKINYDVQGNTNFSVDGTTFLARVDGTLDFSGTTFSTGSETFEF